MTINRRQKKITTIAAQVAAAAAHYLYIKKKMRGKGRPSARIRERRTVEDIYNCLGPRYFRRAYRMSYDSFCVLHNKLEQGILDALDKRKIKGARQHDRAPPIPNGPISTSVRLASALRYFAGGSPYDISVKYGISYTSMMDSVWVVVDAVNAHEEFYIVYPESHEKQKQIAQEFCSASQANFDICVGTIDGILIWTSKPTKQDCHEVGIGQKKFLCGRKNKFGLNCQAVSDCRGRFLDISILYGGATSDCLAFEKSSLYGKLQEGILCTGYCLFGDNAYLNSKFMATPYANVSQGPQDDYNFFHSQLRIRVECAFGMFTERWSILRSAIPRQITIRKTISLVHALAKLHNFCIDIQDVAPLTLLDGDSNNIVNNINGSVPLEQTDDIDVARPLQLLGGGDHFDDHPRELRRNQTGAELPRQILLEKVVESHLRRPNQNR
jgi:hypothetical protein